MEIFFCETCGRRVSDVEIDRGECRKVGDQVWCKACIAHAPPPQPRFKPPTPLRMPSQVRQRPKAVASPAPQQKSSVALFAAAFGIGLVVAVLIVVLASGRRQPPKPIPLPQPPPSTAPAPVAPTITKEPSREVGPAPATSGGDDLEEYRKQLKKLAEPAADRESSGAEFFAKLALDEALRYAAANPQDHAAQLFKFEGIERNFPGTPSAARAAEEAKRLREKYPHLAVRPAEPAPLVIETLDCPRRKGRVVIDGRLDEWDELPHECKTPQLILFTPASWKGPEDSHFRFATAYDAEALYIAVDVIDDRLVIVRGEPPWVHDGIEIRIDARPDPPRSLGRGEGEFDQILLVATYPVEPGEELYIWNREKLPPGIRLACVKNPKGYAVELAIPTTYLDAKQGRPWDSFRLNICVDDMDGAPGDRNETAQIWWRPDWRHQQNVRGSGTFIRR